MYAHGYITEAHKAYLCINTKFHTGVARVEKRHVNVSLA